MGISIKGLFARPKEDVERVREKIEDRLFDQPKKKFEELLFRPKKIEEKVKDVAEKAREGLFRQGRESEERAKQAGLAFKAMKRKEAEDALRRHGRRASILTSAKGLEDQLGIVNRPEAKAATKLGG